MNSCIYLQNYLSAHNLQFYQYSALLSILIILFISMDSSPQLPTRIQYPLRTPVVLKPIASKDNPESSTASMSPTVHRKKMAGMFEGGGEFPSIFVKHKRSAYSGYKQYNMNKSKIIKFHHESKELPPYQTPRQFEVNLKNIAKLRKRFSLEPMVFRKHKEESVCRSEMVQPKGEEIGTERRHEQELREIMRDMGKEQTTTNRMLAIPNQDEVREQHALYRSKNKSQFERYQPLQDSLERSGSKERVIMDIQALPVTLQKPYYVQLKHRVENKLQQGRLDRSKVSIQQVPSGQPQQQQEDHDLCGWSNQSFYPKRAKANFFHQHSHQPKPSVNPT